MLTASQRVRNMHSTTMNVSLSSVHTNVCVCLITGVADGAVEEAVAVRAALEEAQQRADGLEAELQRQQEAAAEMAAARDAAAAELDSLRHELTEATQVCEVDGSTCALCSD